MSMVSIEELNKDITRMLLKQRQQFQPITRINGLDSDKRSYSYICGEDRNNVVRWLIHANRRSFHFHTDTVCTGITMFDRFLCVVNARPIHLKLIGIACFYLAAKTTEEDERIPDTTSFIRGSEIGCSIAELLRMEMVVCDKLQWDFVTVTPFEILKNMYTHLHRTHPGLLDSSKVPLVRQLNVMVRKLTAIMCDHRYSVYAPATIATSLFSLELERSTHEWFPLISAQHERVKDDVTLIDLIHCRERIDQYLHDLTPDMRVPELDYGLVPKEVQPQTHSAVHHQAAHTTRATKRKIEDIMEESTESEDDIYDDIKRLYNEHPDQKYSSCGMQACQDSNSAISLQSIAN